MKRIASEGGDSRVDWFFLRTSMTHSGARRGNQESAMSPRIKAFAVLIGVGMASSAGAAERTEAAVGPFRSSAVQTQKAVGPRVYAAVQTQKTVGPSVFSAVKTQKTVGPRIYAAVKTEKAVGPRVYAAVKTEKAVGAAGDKTTGQPAQLDLNAGF